MLGYELNIFQFLGWYQNQQGTARKFSGRTHCFSKVLQETVKEHPLQSLSMDLCGNEEDKIRQ